MTARVTTVCLHPEHTFHKKAAESIRLIAGIGVEGDAHAGTTVKHRSRVAIDPTQPNLRQVHLMHAELFDELAHRGFAVEAGQLGENITTRGINLLGLPRGTQLHLGAEAVIEVTGLRNPCAQIDSWQRGLLAAVVETRADGTLLRKAGIMAIVLRGGEVRPGDEVRVVLPTGPHCALDRV